MRRATQDVQFLERPDGSAWGICLGYGYLAEHEMGIYPLADAFGIPFKPTRTCNGLDARKVTIVPEDLRLFKDEKRGFVYLLYELSYRGEAPDLEHLDRRLETHDEEDLVVAWSSDDFLIRVKESLYGSKLQALFNALQQKDACIFLGGIGKKSPFSRNSLVISIVSAISMEERGKIREQDLKQLDLEDAAKATGIETRLEKAGLKYYVLSPGWKLESRVKHGKIKTKHKVMFYLNPRNQQQYESGWFTVEELDQWISGKGPIVKKSA